MGYAGGTSKNPDYAHIGDHTETVQVDYDPAKISYSQLLDFFWQSHDPAGSSWSRQYLNAVFYRDEHQREMAMASKNALEQKTGAAIQAEILPLRSFTLAEDYHQKYTLKRYADLTHEMSRLYPDHRDFVNSTAVARMNGYLGDNGTLEQLSREIDLLGLSPAGKKILRGRVGR